jgi:hypothetical protein
MAYGQKYNPGALRIREVDAEGYHYPLEGEVDWSKWVGQGRKVCKHKNGADCVVVDNSTVYCDMYYYRAPHDFATLCGRGRVWEEGWGNDGTTSVVCEVRMLETVGFPEWYRHLDEIREEIEGTIRKYVEAHDDWTSPVDMILRKHGVPLAQDATRYMEHRPNVVAVFKDRRAFCWSPMRYCVELTSVDDDTIIW